MFNFCHHRSFVQDKHFAGDRMVARETFRKSVRSNLANTLLFSRRVMLLQQEDPSNSCFSLQLQASQPKYRATLTGT